LKGKKGRPRLKPPYPTQSGLWNKPTLINNVETLANFPKIIEKGASWYRSFRYCRQQRNQVDFVVRDVKKRGLIEVPFGVSFAEIINDYVRRS
jgi:NADH:ubiquinone oxidoreductase subunit F (NADH-binding)